MWLPTLIGIQLLLITSGQAQDCLSSPPRVRPSECCNSLPMLITKKLAQECGLPPFMAESGRNPPPLQSGERGPGGPGGPKGLLCETILCVSRKNNLLTDNKVNRTAFKTFMEEQYSANWKSAISTAIKTCNSEVDGNIEGCEPKKYLRCFKKNMFINCPAQSWNSSGDCLSLKTFTQNCPNSGPLG